MGSEPADDVEEQGWFEFYDDTITVDPSSAADRVFLAGLRARAVSHTWSCDPGDTWAYHELDDGQHLLRVGMWLDDDDDEHRAGLYTCGVEFNGTRVIGGDAYHDIPFDLDAHSAGSIEFSGTVEALVDRAAEWFEWMLSRPIERRDWLESGQLVCRRWVMADTGQGLVGQYLVKPHRRPDVVTLVRGVHQPQPPLMRWWSFLTQRGK